MHELLQEGKRLRAKQGGAEASKNVKVKKEMKGKED